MRENSDEQFFKGPIKQEDVEYFNNIPEEFKSEDFEAEFKKIKEAPVIPSNDNIDKILDRILKGDDVLEFNVNDKSLIALRNKNLQIRVELSKMDESDPRYFDLQARAEILKKILDADSKLN